MGHPQDRERHEDELGMRTFGSTVSHFRSDERGQPFPHPVFSPEQMGDAQCPAEESKRGEEQERNRHRHRQYYESQYPYERAYNGFIEDLRADRLDRAYESTSARFKRQMSYSQFEELLRRHPAITRDDDTEQIARSQNVIRFPMNKKTLRTWCYFAKETRGAHGRIDELWVWVVVNDSYLCRFPPEPQVEEIQIREVVTSKPEKVVPSWEQEPAP